jgi:hypothetical protein
MSSKYFPIQTETSCPLKWNWSTVFLNSGITKSCHRTATSQLTPENFQQFHNTEIKLADRVSMINGKWPTDSCKYCRSIEEAGGTSDRMRQLTISNMYPTELDIDPCAVSVEPTTLEVYFNNTCNLGCLYCSPGLSSTIAAENVKFGKFEKHGILLEAPNNQYKNLVPHFWKWFETGFSKLSRLHVLGGEPFYQKEFLQLLDAIELHPNANCELNIVTNLMIDNKVLQQYVERFKNLLITKKLKRVDITCSIDCFGPQQEYVRWGLDLQKWQENFESLMQHKWLYLSINQTISALTINTMPELLTQLQQWRQHRKIGHWFSGVTPGPSYMKPEIFGGVEFESAINKILKLMPTSTSEDVSALEYMKGILFYATSATPDYQEISKLIIYLDEKDRRRGTNWETLFPWLIRYRKYVV